MKKLLEKLKAINWKSKKAIISYIIAFVVLLSGTGITVALNNQNHNIIENNSTSEDNHSSTTSDKETEEKSKEENSNLTNENNSSNNSNSSNSTSDVSSSADTNTANLTNSTPSTNNNTNTNTSSNNNRPSNNTNSNNKPTQPSKPQQPEQPKPHTHTWVHYKEQGHSAKVLVKDSWTEEIPKYETKAVPWCNICEKEIKGESPAQHNKNHVMNGELNGPNGSSGHRTEYIQVQVGVDKIEHPAEYKDEWIVDTPAYDQCSGCGATK